MLSPNNSRLSSRLDDLRVKIPDAFKPSSPCPPDTRPAFTIGDLEAFARFTGPSDQSKKVRDNDPHYEGLPRFRRSLAEIQACSVGELEDSVLSYGFEAIAFYHSFHKDDQRLRSWGIYLIEDRIKALISTLESSFPSRAEAEQVVREYIVRHETFHLRLDLFALGVEEARADAVASERKAAFLPYSSVVYGQTFGTRDCYEEALAEAAALRPLRGLARPVMFAHSSTMPDGYRQFDKHLRDSNLGTDLLLGQVVEAKIVANAYPYRLPTVTRRISNDVPCYVVSSKDIVGVSSGPLLSPPLRKAMPVLRKYGVTLEVRQGGRHPAKFKFPDGSRLPLSANNPDGRMPPYVLKQVAQKLGIPLGELGQEISSPKGRRVSIR